MKTYIKIFTLVTTLLLPNFSLDALSMPEQFSNQSSNNHQHDDCAICLEECDQPETITTTTCNHTFHTSCLNSYRNNYFEAYPYLTNLPCPLCRRNIPRFPSHQESASFQNLSSTPTSSRLNNNIINNTTTQRERNGSNFNVRVSENSIIQRTNNNRSTPPCLLLEFMSAVATSYSIRIFNSKNKEHPTRNRALTGAASKSIILALSEC